MRRGGDPPPYFRPTVYYSAVVSSHDLIPCIIYIIIEVVLLIYLKYCSIDALPTLG